MIIEIKFSLKFFLFFKKAVFLLTSFERKKEEEKFRHCFQSFWLLHAYNLIRNLLIT